MIDTGKLAGAVRGKRGDRSLREVEDEAGVAFNVLSRIEKGHSPDLSNFMRVCEWLGVPMDYFHAKKEQAA